MKFIILALLSFNSFADASFTLPRGLFRNSLLPFLAHDGYLTMEVQYAPVEALFKQLGPGLKNRGEAHITVLTPVEYAGELARLVPMQEIDALAKDTFIQDAEFYVLCLGKGAVGNLEAYFIVVESSDLLSMRREIYRRFVERGGEASAFDPEHFYPHITVGFTKQDLHEADGVIKDRRSCFSPIELVD